MEMQNAKGTRDISPENMIVKNKIIEVIRNIFERYGYSPLDTPILERYDVLASKYAGGSEILKETFRLKDQGNRELALRYDLTVPLARYIAMNPAIKMPFKRYQIGEVFRDGPIKAGRYRQFMQCDADAVGSNDLAMEAEQMKIADTAFEELGLSATIKFNNRKILDEIMEKAGIPENLRIESMLTIDKLEKIGTKKVIQELTDKGVSAKSIETLMRLMEREIDNKETLDRLKDYIGETPGVVEVEELLRLLELFEVPAEFQPSLARGLAYYTGTVFEFYVDDSEIKSSAGAGGRYDNMIGDFAGNNQDYAAVGVSFGVDVILEAYKEKHAVKKKSVVQALIIPLNTYEESVKAMNYLREKGLNVDLSQKKGVSKGLEYASYYGIPHAIIIGEDEVKTGKYTVRDMETGQEEMLALEGAAKKIDRKS